MAIRDRMLVLSKEFGFTPAEIWAMDFGDFIHYAKYADQVAERNRAANKSRRKGRK